LNPTEVTKAKGTHKQCAFVFLSTIPQYFIGHLTTGKGVAKHGANTKGAKGWRQS